MFAWFQEHKIFETVFESSQSHSELMKRSVELWIWLAQRKKFEKEQLDSIWKSSRGAHASQIRVIYDVIERLAPYLATSLLTHLLDKLTDAEQATALSARLLASICKRLINPPYAAQTPSSDTVVCVHPANERFLQSKGCGVSPWIAVNVLGMCLTRPWKAWTT